MNQEELKDLIVEIRRELEHRLGVSDQLNDLLALETRDQASSVLIDELIQLCIEYGVVGTGQFV